MSETTSNLLMIILAVMGASIFIALAGLFMLARSIRRLNVPREADFFTTMRYIPLALAILLDLLDFGLDIFSAPIMWIVLDRMGLPNLRNKATIEALIPLTNVIPTFTVAWFAARMLNLGDPNMMRYDDYDQPYSRGAGRHKPTIIDVDRQ
ncbi:MAG TPA: hypothetical protein VFX76_22795 [Roseiflexaceae bacterium]|nr:hypothetical protein [Roseiflexaceae bacterium]